MTLGIVPTSEEWKCTFIDLNRVALPGQGSGSCLFAFSSFLSHRRVHMEDQWLLVNASGAVSKSKSGVTHPFSEGCCTKSIYNG